MPQPHVEELAIAVNAGDMAKVRVLLNARPELVGIDMAENNEHRALHYAVLRRDAAMVRVLMEAGADARKGIYPHRDATSALTIARDREYREIVAVIEEGERLRLARQASMHKQDIPSQTPLDAAVTLGDLPRVRQLIQDDPTALHRIGRNGGLLTLAVRNGQIAMASLLLDLGADVDERIVLEELEEPTPSWGMPLWWAALANQREIAELLLDRGADPNANVYASGWPLRNAWNHQDGAIKKLLLDRGAKRQPYMVAEDHDVSGAEQLLRADSGEDLARELAWSAADHGCPAILELALPRLKWPPGDPRWHWILIQPIRGATSSDTRGNHQSMAALLRHGVDPNISRYGQTALHFSAGYAGKVSDEDRARFASMLLDYGARLDLRDDLLRSTPLGWACRWGRPKLAELLIARGSPVDEPDAEPWATPKAWAAKMGHAEI